MVTRAVAWRRARVGEAPAGGGGLSKPGRLAPGRAPLRDAGGACVTRGEVELRPGEREAPIAMSRRAERISRLRR